VNPRAEREHCEAVAQEVFVVVAQGGPPMPALQQGHLQRTLAGVIARERSAAVADAQNADRELAVETPTRWERVRAAIEVRLKVDLEHEWPALRDFLKHELLRAEKAERERDAVRAELMADKVVGALEELDAARARIGELEAELNNPQTAAFVQAVVTEAAHQRMRWPSAHDAGKAPEDWFWLLGYLGGKALREDGDEKRLHRIIAAAAACANWYLHATGADTRMRPGIAPPANRG